MAFSRAVARGGFILTRGMSGEPLARVGLLRDRKPVLRPSVFIVWGTSRCLFYKSPRTTLDSLRIWKLLEYLGLDYCTIIRFRRRMKRFTYPWLAYCVPAALILAMGDFIAQYHLKPHDPDRTIGKFFKNEWVKGETLLFSLMGLFLVGPVLSKWNLYFYRKMKCHRLFTFLLQKLALDLFIISPFLLTLMALIYGSTFGMNLFKEDSENRKKDITENYFPEIKDAMTFNIITRPAAVLGIYYLAPLHLRRLVRAVYEIIYSAYVSSSFRRHLHTVDSPSPPENLAGGGSKRCDAVNLDQESRWARYKRWACRNRD